MRDVIVWLVGVFGVNYGYQDGFDLIYNAQVYSLFQVIK